MARTLDFNALTLPTLELTMKDADRTVVRVSTPTEGLYQRMLAAGPDIKNAVNGGNLETTKAIFDLCAEVISCNTNGLTVTAEDLRDKFKLTLYDLIVFMGAYMDFLGEIKTAKN